MVPRNWSPSPSTVTEDAPVIGGTATEQCPKTAPSPPATRSPSRNVDTNDNPISFNDQASTLGGNGFGNFELTAGV